MYELDELDYIIVPWIILISPVDGKFNFRRGQVK